MGVSHAKYSLNDKYHVTQQDRNQCNRESKTDDFVVCTDTFVYLQCRCYLMDLVIPSKFKGKSRL